MNNRVSGRSPITLNEVDGSTPPSGGEEVKVVAGPGDVCPVYADKRLLRSVKPTIGKSHLGSGLPAFKVIVGFPELSLGDHPSHK